MGVPALPVSESIGRPRTLKARAVGAFERLWDNVLRRYQVACIVGLLLLIPIKDTRPVTAAALYDHAHELYLRGDLTRTQREAEQGYRRFLGSEPELAARFQLLLARALISRGMTEDALKVLALQPSLFKSKEANIASLALEGVANTYLSRFSAADQKFEEAVRLCAPPVYATCVDVPIGRGVLALERERPIEARQLFLDGLSLSRSHQDRRAETSVLVNLGWVALQTERYDEAVDWSSSAYRRAVGAGSEFYAENALGNLGWAYFQLGDRERALALLLDAEQRAASMGTIRDELKWMSTAAYVYRDKGDLASAAQGYQKSLELAKQINSQEDIIDALEDLTHTSIRAGKLDEAGASLDQLNPLVGANGKRVDQLYVMLAQGEIAAARRQDAQAESLFGTVEHDSASQTSMRLEAEHHLAKLYEAEGNTAAEESAYRSALTTFAAAREELEKEESKLPFRTNAASIYDDYIHFLVQQGRGDEALAAADQGRALTLAQGLALTGKQAAKLTAQPPAASARKAGGTVLFYWLGEKQSYLWAITAKKTALFTLPAQAEISPLIERYRKALLEPNLGLASTTDEGQALYRMLVAPAADLIPPNANVAVVCDGPLSLLNFETLLVPGTKSGQEPHYWIEDANVVSAPSLYMLASARASHVGNRKLLLMGDAVSPNPDYPDLPMAAAEMRRIEKHFAGDEETVLAREKATSSAYLGSGLQNYSYIHFVAHGVASRTDPLDSAIILSRTGAAEDSFKLHARDIIQHPIDARLVTISACYGGGTRSYAGEGLVGLSWAFLRAGAHNVIGALWEASDDSTPQLMDSLYQGLEDGMAPSAALRQAKLALLHSPGKFSQPFYWAPFQIYAGL